MSKATFANKPITLKDGEALIWQAQPAQGVIRNPVHMAVGGALLALGLWLAIGGYAGGAMLGLLLMIIGGYLAYFHANLEAKRRAGTYYGLTNQRALLAYGIRVLAYRILPKSRIELKKGRYDILYFAVDRQLGVQQGSSLRRVGFGHLENSEEPYRLMLDIQKRGAEHG